MKPAAHIVVGGGLNGLMLADLLAGPGAEVVVVESEPNCGGLLRSFDYGAPGRFDYGTHILSQTGEPALDAYLAGLLPVQDWNFLRGGKRDLAGLYFRGRLQLHSSYPDLTRLPPPAYAACLADFFARLSDDDGADAVSAGDYLARRFGPVIGGEVAGPLVERFGRAPAAQLDRLAARLVPLNRMAMFPAEACRDLVGTRRIGPRVAYVDQRDIPAAERSTLAAFYPRRRGLQQVIDALVARLAGKGVRILCGKKVLSLRQEASGVSVALEGGNAPLAADRVYWTANPLLLAGALGVKVRYDQMDRPLTTVLCHYLVRQPSALADLYYAYCADPGFATYRVTNYAAYCPDDETGKGTPLTCELLLSDEELAARPGDFAAVGHAELVRMGIAGDEAPLFARAEVLKYGFPRPTLRNAAEFARLRGEIAALAGERIAMLGIGAREGRFFMVDVLRDTFTFARERRLP